jgi:hypothetical protein
MNYIPVVDFKRRNYQELLLILIVLRPDKYTGN